MTALEYVLYQKACQLMTADERSRAQKLAAGGDAGDADAHRELREWVVEVVTDPARRPPAEKAQNQG